MEHIFPMYDQIVQKQERESFLNQKAGVFWLTGLSGSGKSTIAKQVERMLFNQGYFVQLLDGDNVRSGLCNNLGFSLEDRKENIRRIAELSALYIKSGIVCINAFISPTHSIRSLAKSIIGEDEFHEIHVDSSLQICEDRDVKGLYKKARKGEIKNFTGIDSPYEAPNKPDIIVSTENKTPQESSMELYKYIINKIQLQ